MNQVNDIDALGVILFYACALPMLLFMAGLLVAAGVLELGLKPSDLRWIHQRRLDRGRYNLGAIRELRAGRRKLTRASCRHPLRYWQHVRESNEAIHRLRQAADLGPVDTSLAVLEEVFGLDAQIDCRLHLIQQALEEIG